MNGRLVKVALVLLALVILFMGRMVHRWHDYVTSAKSPYDEVGSDLNTRMPLFMRKWGCSQLQKRFGDAPPPLGCKNGTGGWGWN